MSASLTTLPTDLHLYLFTFLDWPSVGLLRATNHYFYNVHTEVGLANLKDSCIAFNLHTEAEHRRQLQVLLGPYPLPPGSNRVEHWGDIRKAHFTSFPCYTCLRWRDVSLFSNGMSISQWLPYRHQGKRRDLGEPDARSRICVPCGIRTHMYRPWGGCSYLYSVCTGCGCLMDAEGKADLSYATINVCRQCLALPVERRGSAKRDLDERLKSRKTEKRRLEKESRHEANRKGMLDWGLWRQTKRGKRRRSESAAKQRSREVRRVRRFDSPSLPSTVDALESLSLHAYHTSS